MNVPLTRREQLVRLKRVAIVLVLYRKFNSTAVPWTEEEIKEI